MMTTIDAELEILPRLSQTIRSATEEAAAHVVGLEARLNSTRAGRYNQRKGAVTGVIPDVRYGLVYLVMVFYADQDTTTGDNSRAYLNSDVSTRRYWPIHEIEFTGRRVFTR